MKTANIEVTLIDSCGSDLTCVNAARVSFAKESELEFVKEGKFGGLDEWRLQERDAKLINYLAKHKHTSPFNHSFLSFRVKAPIFVARQLVKHKFLPWNEVSRRYVDEEPEFYFPSEWRGKALDKKQGSSGTHINQSPEWINHDAPGDPLTSPYTLADDSVALYNTMIEEGYSPEQARMHLPQNTMTEWVWSGTLGAFCDMLRLRLGADTQEETREVATLISRHVQRLFPISYGALLNE